MPETFTDAERFPLLSEHGRRMLQWLREHPHAPRYTARCGHRLTAEGLRRVRAFEDELRTAPKGWKPGSLPPWLAEFVALCFREVPFYRSYGAPPADFFDIPACDRADLSREPWSFVPDSQPLDDLIVYTTSGTSGHPLIVPTHPISGACYLPLTRLALATRGITLQSGRGQVACLLVGLQLRSYTYPSVIPDLDDAGYAKLNLHPVDWRDPDDRARFLDACNPEIYTGDPIAFAELARLPLRTRPKALISTAMMMLPGLRQALEAHFGCPVLDVYSLNESGPVAFAEDQGFALLQHRLYVEILDPEGAPCPPGTRGEVTLSGGFNPFLPLLRYRTGDEASLAFRGSQPLLVGLAGRPATIFYSADGREVNNLDVTGMLKPFALPQFTLHQAGDGSLHLRVRGATVEHAAIRAALLALFGPDQALTIEEAARLGTSGDKVIQYTSDYHIGDRLAHQ